MGPYEIPLSLGAGGVGEVYKARDTRLDRILAIEALPRRKQPIPVTVYDVSPEDGIDYVVMEFVEGKTSLWMATLDQLIPRGGIPIGEILGQSPASGRAGRFISAQLYGVQANDPWVAGIAVSVLSLIAAMAGLVPARRASRIDPLLALRYD